MALRATHLADKSALARSAISEVEVRLGPLLEAGLMPRLARLRERGASGTLRSTIPTYTPPAWTSSLTGVNPGRHGVYGFVEMVIFVSILAVGLIYAWKKGALKWV